NYGNFDTVPSAPNSSTTEASQKNDSENSYTKTNIQVSGVDEGDIVKVDGSSIYMLTQNGFVIVNVNNGNMTKTCEIIRQNYVPLDLYVNNNKLIMIGGVYEQFIYRGKHDIMPAVDCMAYFYYYKTEIAVYNIENKENPVLERSVTVDGSYLTSRMIDNKIYYIINYGFYYGNKDTYIPKIIDSKNSTETEISINDMYYFKDVPLYNYTILGYINLTNTKDLSQKAYLGVGGEIYVNLDNIYSAAWDYSQCVTRDLFGHYIYDSSKARTRILKFDIKTLNFKESAKVEGTIKDRYSLDEYKGNLRIATTTSNWSNNGSSYSTVFVLDKNLKQVGKVSGIGVGESIYSVRFNETKCVVVTFLITDPLYIVDLTDPNNPTVNNGLKEDGVSYYLHYVGDTGLIIGFGRDTEEIAGTVTWKGLKVSLYKEQDGELVNLDTVTIGNACSYAEALYNPKAILADFENYNFFGFACEVWESENLSDWYNYNLKTQAFYLFSIDFENEKFFEPGILSNFDEGLNYNYGCGIEAFYSWYDNYSDYIKRSVAIGDYIYTISDKYITSYSIDDLNTVFDRKKIADFIPAEELFIH
ncbi:MAG: beta-propeller domain-containing protein, partial [Firmicutes bacterium]|nr:beta-propeller domain-containing protein [Bacillota bacterium]